MRTPAGKECPYFYGNYFRGRSQEECRLLAGATPPKPWKPSLCYTCPVPGIVIANACPHMVLEANLARPFPFISRQVKINPRCEKTGRRNFDAHIGCGECHPLPDIFSGGDRETNPVN